MIGVLADDFTGAAEAAGAAFAAGYSAEVQTVFDPGTDADVVVVDTETRDTQSRRAVSTAAAAARLMRMAGPEWVFKKVDSLFRGHVAAEVRAVQHAFGLRRALVAAANPAIGRTIQNGRYLVGGVPLARSTLYADPLYPRTSSDVAHLLGASPSSRLSVPDVASIRDLDRLALMLEPDTLAAGSGAFFEAMLRVRGAPLGAGAAAQGENRPERPPLFVCGSMAAWRAGRADEAARRGIPVFTFPPALLHAGNVEAELETFVRSIRSRKDRVFLAIGTSEPVNDVAPGVLEERLAAAAHRLLTGFRSVFVEGGASAAALIRRSGWTRLRVVHRFAPGVVTLSPHGAPGSPTVTTKAGSYAWPEAVWEYAARRDR